MRIVIAGGHGKIARLLARRLAASGHDVAGIIRNPEQVADVEAAGDELGPAAGRVAAVVCDLELANRGEVAEILQGADVAVFAAGAGPGSSAERKLTLDRDGAILLADAAVQARVPRFVIVSAWRADDFDPASDDVFQVYLRAKAEADAAVRAHDGLEWTVVRPGSLTDEPGTGAVEARTTTERGTIPREDVAAVLAAVIEERLATRVQFEVVSGRTPVREALEALEAPDQV